MSIETLSLTIKCIASKWNSLKCTFKMECQQKYNDANYLHVMWIPGIN